MWFAVTFGGRYNHEEHPGCAKIDGHAFVRIEAENEMAAREAIHARIGQQWSFMYEWDEFVSQIAEFGLWDATRYVMTEGGGA